MKAANWIDRVKTSKGLPSDYAVAQLLGITRSSVSKYRSSTPTFDEEMSVKIARVLEIQPGVVLADQAMERAKNDEARSAWSQILENLGGVAASVTLMIGMMSGMGYSPDVQAAGSSGNNSNSNLQSYTSYKVRCRQGQTQQGASNPLAACLAPENHAR